MHRASHTGWGDSHCFVPSVDPLLVTTMSNISHDEIRTARGWRLPPRRPGIALLLCLFVLSIVTVWVVNIFQSATIYQSAQRNTIEYEQALYLANAGVHHAVAELENNLAWRGTVSAGSYPASGSYSATAVNGVAAGTVDITSTGVAGGATRRLQSTVLVN
jgi:Tfp pilus assembly protein PilX